MDEFLPLIYLSVLVILLGVAGFFILRQIVKTRKVENTFSDLQNKLQKEQGTPQEYYELASLYLERKLFVQAINLFQKALKIDKNLEPENQALIYNGLGYAYFAQEQYDLAIRQYKEAIKLYPTYIIALNNLGNVYEKKQLVTQALEVYEQVLTIEANNKIAQRRFQSLKKRVTS